MDNKPMSLFDIVSVVPISAVSNRQARAGESGRRKRRAFAEGRAGAVNRRHAFNQTGAEEVNPKLKVFGAGNVVHSSDAGCIRTAGADDAVAITVLKIGAVCVDAARRKGI